MQMDSSGYIKLGEFEFSAANFYPKFDIQQHTQLYFATNNVDENSTGYIAR